MRTRLWKFKWHTRLKSSYQKDCWICLTGKPFSYHTVLPLSIPWLSITVEYKERRKRLSMASLGEMPEQECWRTQWVMNVWIPRSSQVCGWPQQGQALEKWDIPWILSLQHRGQGSSFSPPKVRSRSAQIGAFCRLCGDTIRQMSWSEGGW